MAQHNDATDALTTEQALDNIAARIDDSDNGRTELTEGELTALNLTDDRRRHETRIVEGSHSVDPVRYAIHRFADGRCLDLERHTKQQGDKYTRWYATGVGDLNVEAVGLDGFGESLDDELAKAHDADLDVTIDDDLRARIEDYYESRAEDNVGYIGEGIWGAYGGTYITMEAKDATAGWDPLKRDLTEHQWHAARNAISDSRPSKQRHLDNTLAPEMKVRVEVA